MKPFALVMFAVIVGCSTHLASAQTSRAFPGGFVLCEFDRSGTMTNQGSKLVFAVQNPKTHQWSSPDEAPWVLGYIAPPIMDVDGVHGRDVINGSETLVIKKPITIAFGNFKGGEIDVSFSVRPKSIKRLRNPPWR